MVRGNNEKWMDLRSSLYRPVTIEEIETINKELPYNKVARPRQLHGRTLPNLQRPDSSNALKIIPEY